MFSLHQIDHLSSIEKIGYINRYDEELSNSDFCCCNVSSTSDALQHRNVTNFPRNRGWIWIARRLRVERNCYTDENTGYYVTAANRPRFNYAIRTNAIVFHFRRQFSASRNDYRNYHARFRFNYRARGASLRCKVNWNIGNNFQVSMSFISLWAQHIVNWADRRTIKLSCLSSLVAHRPRCFLITCARSQVSRRTQ